MPPETHSLKDDYRILGLTPGEKPANVKRAYRALAKKCHPDRFHSMPYETRALAEEKFKKLNEAYVRISKTWNRRPGLACTVEDPADAAWPDRKVSDRQWQSSWRRFDRGVYFSALGRALLGAVVVLVLLTPSGEDYFDSQEQGIGERLRQASVDRPAQTQKQMVRPVPSPDQPAPPEHGPLPDTGEILIESEPSASPPAHLLEFPPDPFASYFTIGSPSSDVLRIQGPPGRTQGQTWVYGLSEIHFRQGLVWSFNNFDGSLKVRMQPRHGGDAASNTHFDLGSTVDDVLRVQGTPTRVDRERWYFGFSEVLFKEGRVVEFNNYFGNLKVRLRPASNLGLTQPKGYFTTGSTRDEVVAVQGTPTSIRGNVWTYNFSHVYFRDGKVSSVSNTENILRYISPEDIQNSSAGNSHKNPGS
ncbi:MAG: DnaJ domain-containing protein [Syntrophobacteraceae bacterium]